MKTALALAALALLTGYQATFWAQPPMPGGGCDPSAPGRWISPEPSGEARDERMRLTVDAQCRLVAEKLTGNQTTSLSDRVQVRMARLGGQPYAWLDANALLEYEGVAHRTRDGDLMVFRYRIDGDRLSIWNINHEHVRGLIREGRIPGTLEDTEEDEFNRITGAVPAALVSSADFFDTTTIELVREGAPR